MLGEENHMSRAFRQLIIGVAVFGATTLGSVGIADGVYSYHGADWTRDYNGRQNFENCDNESDSNITKGLVDNDGSGGSANSVTDGNGSGNTCASSPAGFTIARHRTCEKNNIAWDCDNWVST